MTLEGDISYLKPKWISRQTMFSRYGVYELRPSAVLQPEAEEWLIAGLAKAMPQLKIAAYFAVRRATLSSSDHVTVAVARAPPELIGFLCSRWYPETEIGRSFLHASICLISEQHQRTLLFRHLWRLHLEQVDDGPYGFPYIIALKTYNPAVYNTLSAFARLDGVTLYPRLDGAQDESTKQLVYSIQARIAAGLEFDWDTGVVRGAGVPPDFYPKIPDHKRRDICDYFSLNLRPGDRILCVLTLPPGSALRNRVLRMFGAARAS
jgi:hypothetical protein